MDRVDAAASRISGQGDVGAEEDVLRNAAMLDAVPVRVEPGVQLCLDLAEEPGRVRPCCGGLATKLGLHDPVAVPNPVRAGIRIAKTALEGRLTPAVGTIAEHGNGRSKDSQG
jgi:hypothetical protein